MKKRILITVDVDIHHAIRVVAAERAVTVSSVYEDAARQLLSGEQTKSVSVAVEKAVHR
ncbi:MAG: hypothetical protein ACHREM_18420 [Polyangiales bacterium]